jgi:hypothetical protein
MNIYFVAVANRFRQWTEGPYATRDGAEAYAETAMGMGNAACVLEVAA